MDYRLGSGVGVDGGQGVMMYRGWSGGVFRGVGVQVLLGVYGVWVVRSTGGHKFRVYDC